MELFFYISAFAIFVVLQAIFINGVYDCFKGSMLVDGLSKKVDYQGMIFYMMAPKFFERNRQKAWSKPFFSCIMCMSSVYGALTFWPFVIYLFGFHSMLIAVFIMDVFILIPLNRYIYQKI